MASNFSDIVKYQRAQGAGVLGSLGTAIGQSTLQKMDPRNYLFNRKGTMAALFPGLKGYQAKTTSEKISGSGSSGGFSTGQVELITEKLDQVRTQTGLVAKNTLVLPSLARDFHLVKQNIIKLVKLQGGTPTTKAGDFFSRQAAREAAYESKFGNKPTPVNKQEEKKEESWMSKLFGGGLSGIMSGFISALVKGGLIVGALAAFGKAIEKFFTDPEFRDKVFNMIKDFFQSEFGKALMVGVGVVVGVFATFKLALLALEAAVLATARRIGAFGGVPGSGVPTDVPDSDRKKPGQKGPTKDKNGRTLPPRDSKGRFTKLPKPGTSSASIGRAAGIAAILGLLVDSVYTSDDEIAILRDSSFSTSKIFEKLSEEDQAQYLANVYDKSVKEEDLKKFRQDLMAKYNIKATGTWARWKEAYVEGPAPATPVSPTPAAAPAAPTSSPSSMSGGDVDRVLSTIKGVESGGDYKAKNPNSTASGAYQFINGTWQAATKQYGIGQEYKTARDAPPEIQDMVARKSVEDLLRKYNGNVDKVVNVWYTGNPEGNLTAAGLAANRGLTAEAYRARFASQYNGGANLNNSSVAMADGRSNTSGGNQTVNNTQIAQTAPSANKPMEVPDLKVYDSDLARFLLEPVVI